MPRIGVLTYGVGNLFSVTRALSRLGAEVLLLDESGWTEIDGLVVPGVGNFEEGSRNISAHRERIADLIASGVPVLGICLGMQLLFEESEEGPGRGLGILKGRVLRLRVSAKLPHIGWSRLRVVRDCELLEGVNSGDWVYYVHSYAPSPEDPEVVVALSEYAGLEFPAVICSGNLCGTQFHPEKSGRTGMRILGNFVALCVRR
ncbi:MAG: imidazole glycerol phosphate synthase subunit HisH [Nitrososphaerota archaeon]